MWAFHKYFRRAFKRAFQKHNNLNFFNIFDTRKLLISGRFLPIIADLRLEGRVVQLFGWANDNGLGVSPAKT